MAQVFKMPQLGSTMEEGLIVRWHKSEGDTVRKGETLLEIETDKATMEVEADTEGVVRKLCYPVDVSVPIQQPIAIIGSPDEEIETLLSELGMAPSKSSSMQAAVAQVGAPGSVLIEENRPLSTASPLTASDMPAFLSPRARRLAESEGVAITALAGRGSGPDGRVIERDVQAWLAQAKEEHAGVIAAEMGTQRAPARVTPLAARLADDLGIDLQNLALGLPGSRVRSEDVLRHAQQSQQEPAPIAGPKPTPTAPSMEAATEYSVLPFSGMRKRIADNVAKAAFGAPHVTLTLEVDMEECAALRTRLLPDVEKLYGTRLSYTDILVKAVARALEEHPRLNAALAGDEVRLYRHKNIGVAVALEEGLVVPVVKQAELKTLGAISAELKPLIDRARTGKFTPDDVSGGTFSITNLGVFGIDVFDPIIAGGQAAILGVGRIADKPVVINKQIVVRSMMNLCLSFDHRVLDGAPAARFLQRLKEILESPLSILL